jgi:hypothetical protein
MNEMSAPGGTWLACIVAMVDLVTRDSYANVNAECKCPDSWRYRYTRKLTSSADTAMSLCIHQEVGGRLPSDKHVVLTNYPYQWDQPIGFLENISLALYMA